MGHEMKLWDDSFNAIKEQWKTIEMRLNDEKRSLIKCGDIIELLKINKKITNVSEMISSFFEVYIVDAFLGNFGRHGNNWGFLKKDNKYRLAPIFDNGSCLFPNLVNEDELAQTYPDRSQN